mmetsp:Transcript_14508/g.31438  ORF Transcript_14508/g.31438 Transcript_14508/m.31438 type:complete len:120 (+) Transcript_14508:640-999(+)
MLFHHVLRTGLTEEVDEFGPILLGGAGAVVSGGVLLLDEAMPDITSLRTSRTVVAESTKGGRRDEGPSIDDILTLDDEVSSQKGQGQNTGGEAIARRHCCLLSLFIGSNRNELTNTIGK